MPARCSAAFGTGACTPQEALPAPVGFLWCMLRPRCEIIGSRRLYRARVVGALFGALAVVLPLAARRLPCRLPRPQGGSRLAQAAGAIS